MKFENLGSPTLGHAVETYWLQMCSVDGKALKGFNGKGEREAEEDVINIVIGPAGPISKLSVPIH